MAATVRAVLRVESDTRLSSRTQRSRTWPAALVCTCSFTTAGRVMQRHSCSSAWRPSAPQRTAVCKRKPYMATTRMKLREFWTFLLAKPVAISGATFSSGTPGL